MRAGPCVQSTAMLSVPQSRWALGVSAGLPAAYKPLLPFPGAALILPQIYEYGLPSP